MAEQKNSSLETHRTVFAAALCMGLLMTAAPLTRAQSLFPVKEANRALHGSSSAAAASLFSDTRAHSVGDVLTITVAENTTAASATNTKTAQDDSVNAFGGTGLFKQLFSSLALTMSNSRTGNGAGSTTRTGSLTTTLSVLVKEILPNGTLKIEGSRIVGINRENQKVTFSGVVRPEDIGPDNTVPSNLVAGVEVHYDGKGIVGDTARPGFIARIFRFLF